MKISDKWYIYTLEYYSATKKNKFESVVVRQMNLVCHIGWSKSEREKQMLFISVYIWNLEKWFWWTTGRAGREMRTRRRGLCVEAVCMRVGEEFLDREHFRTEWVYKNKGQRSCEHCGPTSWQTRESLQLLWVNSQFLQPQDKENVCWKVGVRWLVRVLQGVSWSGHLCLICSQEAC